MSRSDLTMTGCRKMYEIRLCLENFMLTSIAVRFRELSSLQELRHRLGKLWAHNFHVPIPFESLNFYQSIRSPWQLVMHL